MICVTEPIPLAIEGWYDQLDGDDSPLAEAILDRIKHDAYRKRQTMRLFE